MAGDAVVRRHLAQGHGLGADRLRERAERLSIGPGIDNHDLGPVVSREQYDKVTAYIDRGKRDGAQLIAGGKRPRHVFSAGCAERVALGAGVRPRRRVR